MDVVVKGSKVLGYRAETYKVCQRCGIQLTVVRSRVKDLTLCGACKSDHWWIERAGS